MLNKIKGALYGLAIGDALGATTEFLTPDEIKNTYGQVNEIIGGGVWQVERGQATDDTEMTIAVMKGIFANSNNPIEEIGKQFLHWRNSNPVDIGITVLTSCNHYDGDWFSAAKLAHDYLAGKSAGNGSLMRCIPIALAYSDQERIKEFSTLQSKMTHFDDEAAEACMIYNQIAYRVLNGSDLETAIRLEIKDTQYDAIYDREPECLPDGYVVHTLKWALYWLLRSDTFEDVVLGAVNKGYDSDTIAAIAGALKGLEVGYEQLPIAWKSELLCKKDLDAYSNVLFFIRDHDTELLKQQLEQTMEDLKRDTETLSKMIEQDFIQTEKQKIVESLKRGIYLSRLSLHIDDEQYNNKELTWRQLENRYLRVKRLVDLGAPNIIVLHETKWLLTMIDHMKKRHQGIEPYFTEDELEELEDMRELDL